MFDTTYFIIHYYIPGWWALGSLPSQTPISREKHWGYRDTYFWLLHGFWASEPRSSCLCMIYFIVFKCYVCVRVCTRARVYPWRSTYLCCPSPVIKSMYQNTQFFKNSFVTFWSHLYLSGNYSFIKHKIKPGEILVVANTHQQSSSMLLQYSYPLYKFSPSSIFQAFCVSTYHKGICCWAIYSLLLILTP